MFWIINFDNASKSQFCIWICYFSLLVFLWFCCSFFYILEPKTVFTLFTQIKVHLPHLNFNKRGGKTSTDIFKALCAYTTRLFIKRKDIELANQLSFWYSVTLIPQQQDFKRRGANSSKRRSFLWKDLSESEIFVTINVYALWKGKFWIFILLYIFWNNDMRITK